MRLRLRDLILAGALLLAACSDEENAALPTPLEPDETAIAYFCQMSLPEHDGPKGQAFIRNQEKPLWFASVSEAFVYLETELARPRDLVVLYVNDMSKGTWERPAAGAWIDVRKAVFVIGSDKTAAMGGQEAVPFATAEAAQGFIAAFGGEIADFEAAAKALAVDQVESGG